MFLNALSRLFTLIGSKTPYNLSRLRRNGTSYPTVTIAITNTSKATATRDLQQLVELSVFKQMGSGRNVHYQLDFLAKKLESEK